MTAYSFISASNSACISTATPNVHTTHNLHFMIGHSWVASLFYFFFQISEYQENRHFFATFYYSLATTNISEVTVNLT